MFGARLQTSESSSKVRILNVTSTPRVVVFKLVPGSVNNRTVAWSIAKTNSDYGVANLNIKPCKVNVNNASTVTSITPPVYLHKAKLSLSLILPRYP